MAARRRKKKAPETLTQALSRLLSRVLVPDLQRRAKQASVDAVLRARHAAEKAGGRTGEAYAQWRDALLEQVGAAWVLSCVFVRTLEDRGLVAQRRLAGPGARDSEQLFFELFPNLTARDYLLSVFGELGRLPGARELLGQAHNLAWRLSPSADGARALLDFFREADAGADADVEGGDEETPRWTFEPSGEGLVSASTRFLGDLYQDLSESVRKRYALLQTPDFVETFILDRTLEPAIEQHGAAAVRVIDPTCGSGHFLLGAFERVLGHLRQSQPGADAQVLARRALGRVYGVDVNPYAVAIARFRLTLAYLEAAGWTRLDQIGEGLGLERQVIVADSLYHRREGGQQDLGDYVDEAHAGEWRVDLFETEDTAQIKGVLGQRYHAVVGNPPYITVKDAALRDRYRDMYPSAAGKYGLGAPFTERFFDLCVDEGFVGLLVSNSFMKRTFGRKLIEEVLPKLDVTQIVDTSGAYIPGCGTPTAILFGRNRAPIKDTVLATLGKRGEPSTPSDPAEGEVWSSIRDHAEDVDFENDYISVDDVPRARFDTHPWTLQGGGASKLKERIEAGAERTLGDWATSIGISAVTGEDVVLLLPHGAAARLGVPETRPMVTGEFVRDWNASSDLDCVWMYDGVMEVKAEPALAQVLRYLWPYRACLSMRKRFGTPMLEKGLTWYELQELYSDKLTTPLTIVFAFVATHNHFVLDRGGKVFNRTAPIIKLPEGATEDEHLALLGYLNSSTACFWMKQVFFPKTNASQKHHPHPARIAYEFAGTGLQDLPLPELETFLEPARLATALGAELQMRGSYERFAADLERCEDANSLHDVLATRWRALDDLRRRLIALQEELDWRAYAAFGFVDGENVALDDSLLSELRVARGQRPFEELAGREPTIRRGGRMLTLEEAEVETALPPTLAHDVRAVWDKRKDAIKKTRQLRLMETLEFKRLWRDTDQNESEQLYRDGVDTQFLTRWLTDRLEEEVRDGGVIEPVVELARRLARDPRAVMVADVLSGRDDADLVKLIGEIAKEEAAPYLAALRYRESGMEKRAQWERTWTLQRREDAGESVEVPVPPKYGSKDFRSGSVYRLRGKLDVPKERFVSYPGAESDEGGGALYGWAGWDHLERAQALAGLFMERKGEGWPAGRLTPLLAGLLELVPWLEQWHDEATDFGQSMGRYFRDFVESEAQGLGLSLDDLRVWRP